MALGFFQRGLGFEAYLSQAKMNVPTLKENYEETVVSPEDDLYFRSLLTKVGEKGIKVIAISESWCGDCVENLPILAKLADLYPVFDLRIFPRDENLDIMDRYLTGGKRTIPVFVFFDRGGQEIGRFIERPKKAHAFLESEKAKLRDLPEEEKKRALCEIRTELRKLYREGFRHETVKEIRQVLELRYR